MIRYLFIFVFLVISELLYFKLAQKLRIVDKPNERSSHSTIVIRGGGIVFLLGIWMWSIVFGFHYPWLLLAVSMAAGTSFMDDIYSLPDSIRLIVHFVAILLLFYEVQLYQWDVWWFFLIALIVCVGAMNIFNFMDGINGMTGGYSLVVLIPLMILNHRIHFVEESLLVFIGISLLVFCFFNFRTKAKCFSGDVGSIGIATLLLFAIGKLIMKTGDITWFVFLIVYGVDGCLTIIHRIMLHEKLGTAHRKHVYQLLANELSVPHIGVSVIYMCIQLFISSVMIFVIPDTFLSHWLYMCGTILVLSLLYIFFMKKYYHFHSEYLESLNNKLKNK